MTETWVDRRDFSASAAKNPTDSSRSIKLAIHPAARPAETV